MSRRPLSELLDKVEAAHKSDVQELTSGHLNQSKLKKFQRKSYNELLESSEERGQRSPDFKSAPKIPIRRVRLPPPEPVAGVTSGAAASPLATPPQAELPELHKEALIEELPTHRRINIQQEQQQQQERGANAAAAAVLQACQSEGTFADNFRRRRQLQKRLVREQDVQERHLLTGAARVKDLEIRLQESLQQQLGSTGVSSGPSFHRLQIYGAAMQEIVQQSATFGSLLAEIQAAYDMYLSQLLDSTAPAQHRHLSQQLSQLRNPQAEGELRLCTELVEELELEAERQLLESSRLLDERRQLQQLPPIEEEIKEEDRRHYQQLEAASAAAARNKQELVGDRCQRLLQQIWRHLDDISQVRRQLREELAPLVSALHLEKCCQQANTDWLRVETELNSLRQSNEQQMQLVLAAIDAEPDTPDEQRARVETLLSNRSAEFALGNEELDLDPELLGSDEEKWRWYIS